MPSSAQKPPGAPSAASNPTPAARRSLTPLPVLEPPPNAAEARRGASHARGASASPCARARARALDERVASTRAKRRRTRSPSQRGSSRTSRAGRPSEGPPIAQVGSTANGEWLARRVRAEVIALHGAFGSQPTRKGLLSRCRASPRGKRKNTQSNVTQENGSAVAGARHAGFVAKAFRSAPRQHLPVPRSPRPQATAIGHDRSAPRGRSRGRNCHPRSKRRDPAAASPVPFRSHDTCCRLRRLAESLEF